MSEQHDYLPAQAEFEPFMAQASPGDAALLAQRYLDSGAHWHALMACRAARAAGLDEPALALIEAVALVSTGDVPGGIAILDEVLRQRPSYLQALYLKALECTMRGDAAAAIGLLRQTTELVPDFPGVYDSLARLLMPGPNYREVLAAIHGLVRPRGYLEIGVSDGSTLALAAASERAVGVEPRTVETVPLPSSADVIRATSDVFFETQRREALFGEVPVDLVFVDGLHHFEMALMDFARAESWATTDSTIVLHDCVPLSARAAARPRRSAFWAGDVWKVVEVLATRRPDLRIRTIPTGPSGLVVVRRLDPRSRILFDTCAEAVETYRDAAYPYEAGLPEHYGLVANAPSGWAAAVEREPDPAGRDATSRSR